MRVLLGVGESVTFPASSKMIACHVPPERIGFANGLIIAGIKAGPAVGAFGAGLLIAKHGWRPVFIAIGLISLLWLPAWKVLMPRAPSATQPSAATDSQSPSILQILRERSFWGASFGHFSANYYLYVMVTWLPFYLVRERHLSLSQMAKISSLYFLTDAASALFAGWFSDYLIHHGFTTTFIRKSAMAIGHITAALGFAMLAIAGGNSYLTWLLITGVGTGIGGSGIYTYCQILAGPRAAGTWTGLQNGFGNFAGIIAPAVTGFLVDQTGNFRAALALSAAVTAAGALGWTVLVPRLEPLPWSPRQ
jgi:MFS family permease